MKINKIFHKIALLLIAILSVLSCQDREMTVVENQTAPIILDLSKETLFLDKNFPQNSALTLTWEVAKYNMPTEISYKIETSATSDFKEVYVLGTAGESARTVTYSVEDMNKATEALGLLPNQVSTLYFRVVSVLGAGNYVPSTSNVTSLKITPYELVFPDFYLVGAASPVGWSEKNAMLLTKNKEMSTIVTTLNGGEPFRFLGQKAWGPSNYSIDKAGTRDSYRYFKMVSSNIIQDGEENMKFTGTTGTYKITINAKEQSLTITAQ